MNYKIDNAPNKNKTDKHWQICQRNGTIQEGSVKLNGKEAINILSKIRSFKSYKITECHFCQQPFEVPDDIFVLRRKTKKNKKKRECTSWNKAGLRIPNSYTAGVSGVNKWMLSLGLISLMNN